MRHCFWILIVLLALPASAQEPPRAYDHVVVHTKVLELRPDGTTKVLAEPVLRTDLSKPITFHLGQEVPIKTPLGNGLETIDYLPVGIRMELTFDRIEGAAAWGSLITESVELVDDTDGLVTTVSHQRRKRGKFQDGKTVKTAPIKVSEDEADKRRLQFEFRIELATSAEAAQPQTVK